MNETQNTSKCELWPSGASNLLTTVPLHAESKEQETMPHPRTAFYPQHIDPFVTGHWLRRSYVGDVDRHRKERGVLTVALGACALAAHDARRARHGSYLSTRILKHQTSTPRLLSPAVPATQQIHHVRTRFSGNVSHPYRFQTSSGPTTLWVVYSCSITESNRSTFGHPRDWASTRLGIHETKHVLIRTSRLLHTPYFYITPVNRNIKAACSHPIM